jgi:hypothetical protein
MVTGPAWRTFAWRWLLAVLFAAVVIAPSRPASPEDGMKLAAAASSSPQLEVSSTCIAVNQRITSLLVWGSGFDSWLAAKGTSVSIEWHWGGEPSTPDPATVNPTSQQATPGAFTLSYDITGKSVGSGGFVAVARSTTSTSPTSVGTVNIDIKQTCPTGSASCTVAQGVAVMLVQVQGYDTTWSYTFFYQYHLADQVGPVTGTAGSDGAVHGQFNSPPQDNPTLVTAHIVQPAQGDTSSRVYDVSFAAPVCRVTTTTTTAATTTTTSRTTTTTARSATTSPTTSPTPTSTPPTVPGAPPTAPAPAAPSGSTAQPATLAVLSLNPGVGPAGFVTVVTGTGFPPNSDVVVAWQGPPGTATAHTDATGLFTVGLLVMPNDDPGPRSAVAPGFPGVAAPFLVVPSSVQPPSPNRELIIRG